MEKQLFQELHIGNRILPGNVALAPMAGTSDLPFRTICHRQGASFVCTELVSARGIRYSGGVLKSYRYLEIEPAVEGPVAIQLFGHDPEDFREAIPLILEHPVLRGAFSIDLNMGCPVNKVVKTGAGSALMTNLPLASSILTAAVRAAEPYGVPVTVKFRKGWDDAKKNAVEFARLCLDSGAKAMTLHARTRNQMYGGQADWACIREVAEAIRGSGVPLFGNGDVVDGKSAVAMLTETGCDGVMVGRAAQGNPWIFAEIVAALRWEEKPAAPFDGADNAGAMSCMDKAATLGGADNAGATRGMDKAATLGTENKPEPPSPEERANTIREHLHGLSDKLGERMAVLEMRAQLAMYFKGQPHATTFKVAAMSAETIGEVEALLAEWVRAQTVYLG